MIPNAGRLLSISILLGCLPATAAFGQQLGGGQTPTVSIVRVFLALLVCLIVAVLAALLLRQKIRGGSLPLFTKLGARSDRIQLVESRRIAPQSDLCLVRFDEEEYFLVIASGSATVLSQKPAEAVATSVA